MAGPSYTHAELEALWLDGGGEGGYADTAAAIAEAESGGCQYAKAGPLDDRPQNVCTYRYTTTEDSYGLWQINRDAHPQYAPSDLYNAVGNAVAAVAISNQGTDFGPWTTYKNGSYRQYLSGAINPPPSPGQQTYPAGPAHVNLPVNSMTRAWAQLTRTLAITAPRTLRAEAAARARIRRAVR